MKNIGTPLVAATCGGVVALAVALPISLTSGGGTTTLVQQAPLSAAPAASKTTGLTARDIYKRDAPGVVFITSQIVQQQQSTSPFDFPQQQQGQATGSGFVINRNGTILTNAHVIQGAAKITVQLGDHKVVDAKVVGKDPNTDLALLKIPTDGVSLTPLALGDSKNIQVGDPTIAIGNPFGLDRTLTTGVVSALQRQIKAPNGFSIDNVIQTDAPINPGNSGGPLLDAFGRVIGINSQIETGGGSGSVGIGFAVPIDTAKQVIPQLEQTGTVTHAYLGLTSLTIDGSLASLNLPVKSGALVQTVQRNSPADKAGIKGGDISAQLPQGQIELGGDIITAVDGKAVNSSDELASAIGSHKPGDSVTLSLLHGGQKRSVSVKLGSRPTTAPSAPSATG
jgi:S1-C subfamily serine protease